MKAPGLLYIAGTGRCGSTILDIVLGNHTRIESLGEFYALTQHPDGRVCSCGKPTNECSYWNQVKSAFVSDFPEFSRLKLWNDLNMSEEVNLGPKRTRPSLADIALLPRTDWLYRALANIDRATNDRWEGANNSWKLYSTISKLKGVDYIIDSSKHAKRMKVLYLRKPRSTRIIHLVRDGRALAHTYKRGGSSVIDAAHQWVRITQNILIMLKGVPRDRWRRVYYEDLCRQPAETIGQLLSWVGLESESDMYEPHGGEYHLIPGNQLIFEGISSIKLKEDWREGLSGREKAEFESIAGSLLKSLGYL